MIEFSALEKLLLAANLTARWRSVYSIVKPGYCWNIRQRVETDLLYKSISDSTCILDKNYYMFYCPHY
jgi:hypothetical protein